MHSHREEIARLQQALEEQDATSPAFMTAEELAQQLQSRGRRPSIVVSVRENIGWIVGKFEKFRPGRQTSGVFLLVLRMMQTSVLVLVPRQNLQSAAACAIALVAACVLRETMPFRRQSDNEVAVMTQYCVFLWCFAVVLREMGISDPQALILMGIVLIVATVGVFCFALWRARAELNEVRSERQQEGRRANTPADEENRTDPVGFGETDDADNDGTPAVCDTSSTEPKHGGNSPQDIEMTVTTTTDERRCNPLIEEKSPPWQQLFGLCAAESEGSDSGPQGGPRGAGELAALREEVARLTAALAAAKKPDK